MVRSPTTADAEAILAVCIARDVHDTGRPDYTLEDVQADLAMEEVDVWVFDEAGEIAAAGFLDPRGCQIAVHPERDGGEAGRALREALRERARERGMDTLREHVNAANEIALGELRAASYVLTYHYVRFRVEPDGLPEAMPAVPGRRPYRPGDDDRAAYALITEAFADIRGDVPTSYEMFRGEVLDKSTFAADLSFAAEVGGELVGVVLSERREGVGHVADLAVRRGARGRGLGRGLLLSALAAFRADGLDGGELWANGVNVPAVGLYESAGLREVARSERWEKPVAD